MKAVIALFLTYAGIIVAATTATMVLLGIDAPPPLVVATGILAVIVLLFLLAAIVWTALAAFDGKNAHKNNVGDQDEPAHQGEAEQDDAAHQTEIEQGEPAHREARQEQDPAGQDAAPPDLSDKITGSINVVITVQGVVLGLVFAFIGPTGASITVRVGLVALAAGLIFGLLLYSLSSFSVPGPLTASFSSCIYLMSVCGLVYGLLCIVSAAVAGHAAVIATKGP